MNLMMKKNATTLDQILLLLFLFLCFPMVQAAEKEPTIETVNGPVSVTRLGLSLSHEHIMSNFGKEAAPMSGYNEAALFSQVIPYLRQLKALGIQTVFDCTTAYFGRRVDLLKQIADSCGLQIITNTGFYGSANDKYGPEFAFSATKEEIAKQWIEEFENGIDGTGIRPGFIKMAFDKGTPSAIDKKLFEAGLITHLSTGLTMAVHTGDNPEAIVAQLKLLAQHHVSPKAWIWVHANQAENTDLLIETAKKGAWISLDGIKENNIDAYVERLTRFKNEKLLDKVLLSHDGNGFPSGKAIRPFDVLVTRLIPALQKAGFSEDDVNLLTIENPQNAFEVKVRKTH